MRYITKLEVQVKKLRTSNRKLKKENKDFAFFNEEFMLLLRDLSNKQTQLKINNRTLKRHLKLVYGAYIILAIATLLMIINFYFY